MTNCDGLLPGKRGPSAPVVKPGGASSFLSQIQSQMQSKEEMGGELPLLPGGHSSSYSLSPVPCICYKGGGWGCLWVLSGREEGQACPWG